MADSTNADELLVGSRAYPNKTLDQVQHLIQGIRNFADDMREQGIHVGLSLASEVRCVTCDAEWPCPASRKP